MGTLSTLPEELRGELLKHLGFDGKIRLSATCKAYRAWLAPELFETIRFNNLSEKSTASALAAVEAYGPYTTRIEFTCTAEPEEQDTEETGFTHPALPPAARKILEGLATPNLRTAEIRFYFKFGEDDEGWDEDDEGLSVRGSDVFWEIDNDNDLILTKEQRWEWRSVMKETWEALATNSSVKELICEDFIPKWISTFRTDAFRQFLGRLESATFNIVSLNGDDNAVLSYLHGYSSFLANLDDSFFHHMTALKNLHIQAADPLGCVQDEWHYTPLALKSRDLPALTSLKLEHCFVCSELVLFVQSHAQILKSLDVNDCFALGDSLSRTTIHGPNWADFFDAVFKASPALTALNAGRSTTLFTQDGKIRHNHFLPGDVQHISQAMEVDPKVRLFGYAHIERSGVFLVQRQSTMENFMKGDDQRAYERLMGRVAENVAREDEQRAQEQRMGLAVEKAARELRLT
ncbi:hypothetical protein V502_03912 [Pseudogymnoascus sp. VKM F-4520 (FW-2644)]|nr:hypothetical protein V502_03912 [Pseudogymnoascus sp. VKM F-4520 (FW-2644)]